jgi:hypothetical protein
MCTVKLLAPDQCPGHSYPRLLANGTVLALDADSDGVGRRWAAAISLQAALPDQCWTSLPSFPPMCEGSSINMWRPGQEGKKA